MGTEKDKNRRPGTGNTSWRDQRTRGDDGGKQWMATETVLSPQRAINT